METALDMGQRRVCGFYCPNCRHCCSEIVGKDVVHILELKCLGCGTLFACEAG